METRKWIFWTVVSLIVGLIIIGVRSWIDSDSKSVEPEGVVIVASDGDWFIVDQNIVSLENGWTTIYKKEEFISGKKGNYYSTYMGKSESVQVGLRNDQGEARYVLTRIKGGYLLTENENFHLPALTPNPTRTPVFVSP